jgi:redox-sensitive bicupin YhaK (pirin superfamily)
MNIGCDREVATPFSVDTGAVAMAIEFSPAIWSRQNASGGPFSVRAIDLSAFGEWSSPVLVLDHFRVTGRPFPPHPHAGFSAVTYVFEDSQGGLRSRDSLGNDSITGPGGVVWTEAGRGLLHEEVPAENGRELHAVQIFVNLSAKNKLVDPRLLRLESAEIPEWRSTAGDRVRVVVGSFRGTSSPLVPSEPISLFDAWVRDRISFNLPEGHNSLIYMLSGQVEVRTDDDKQLEMEGEQALAAHGHGRVTLQQTIRPAHLLILMAAAIREPIFEYGGFIMNDRSQIMTSIERYRTGRMGHLEPISTTEGESA